MVLIKGSTNPTRKGHDHIVWGCQKRAQTQLVNSVGMYVMTYPLIGEGAEFETQGINSNIKCELSGIRLTRRMEGAAEVWGFPTPDCSGREGPQHLVQPKNQASSLVS